MGLWGKMKGAFGGGNNGDDWEKPDDWDEQDEKYGRAFKKSEADFFVDEEGTTWENPRWAEEREEKERERVYEEGERFREKARERDEAQQEYEEAMRQAKEEQARQEEVPPVDTETAEEKSEPKTASELRRERIEELRQRRELSALESKYTRTGQLKTRLKGAARETFLSKRKSGREESGAKRATKVIRNVATLGGAVHISKARKGYYVPKMDKSLYGTSGMRELTTPSPGRAMQTSTLRRAGTPSYEHLRQTTTFRPRQATPFQPRTTQPTTASPVARMSARTPTHLARPMGFVKIGSQAQDVAAERLRGLTFPTGLTSSEKLAYAEIKANHDIDTKSHVVSELMDLGIDKMEALRAVEGLMSRRIVRRGQSFAGESTLEIAK